MHSYEVIRVRDEFQTWKVAPTIAVTIWEETQIPVTETAGIFAIGAGKKKKAEVSCPR